MLTGQSYCEAASAAGLQEAALAVVKDACCAGKINYRDRTKLLELGSINVSMQVALNKNTIQFWKCAVRCSMPSGRLLLSTWCRLDLLRWICCWQLVCSTQDPDLTFYLYMYDHVQPKESHGNCHELTKRIAKTGCSGKWPANVERDLMTPLELPVASWQANSCILLSLALNLTGAVLIAELFCHIRVPARAQGWSATNKSLPGNHPGQRCRLVLVFRSSQLRHCTLLKSPSRISPAMLRTQEWHYESQWYCPMNYFAIWSLLCQQ